MSQDESIEWKGPDRDDGLQLSSLFWHKKYDKPVKRLPNGTIDWGTPGNKPRLMPIEYYQTFEDIVIDAGFIFNEYKAVTVDGYILSVYRIRSKEYTEKGAPIVFF